MTALVIDADAWTAAGEALLPDAIALRRAIHEEPELGLDLPLTTAKVMKALDGLPLEIRQGPSTTGLIATLRGPANGRTVLLRGDMDALPLTEETGLDFASGHPGVMHACGHDTHVAMLLGGARLLLERRDRFAGRVVLMFQPGEEGYHGARLMIEDGFLDGIEGQPGAAAFAIHISTRYPAGTLNVRHGPLLAAADRLLLTVRGRGGHASAPFLAVDPITVAAELILALQLMVTRTVDALEPTVLTIARVTAGTTNNIIPDVAELEGTLRTLSMAVRAEVHDRIRRVAAVTDLVRDVARELAGPDATLEMDAPIMGAEDFAYVLERVPGMMAFLGARPDGLDPATAPMNHSTKVVFVEEAMALGAATYAAVALRHLGAA